MADNIRSGSLGFRRASGVGEAGWGRTLVVGHRFAFIYFLPVLFIIFTAIKPQERRCRCRRRSSPTSLFGLIPEQVRLHADARKFWLGLLALDDGGRRAGADRISTAISSTRSSSPRVRALLALVIGTLAAFGFSRYPLKGNDTYLFIILTTRMLPAIVVIIPVILMFRVVGLSGKYPGIIMLYTAFNLAFTIWMMKSFFDELSPDVEDAARIDGSSGIRVFFKICLPQVVAGLAATFVFGLILTWNEFLFALLLSGPDTRTVPVAMNQAVSSGGRGTDWTLLAAIETLFLIPVFLVTFFLQNHLLRGVTFGTVKR